MIDGIRSGFSYGVPQLIRETAEAMQRVIAAAKAELEIKSPSRVFEQIGKFTGAGFIQGLKNMAGAIGGAVGGAFDFSGMDIPGIQVPVSAASTPAMAAPASAADSAPFTIHIENMPVRDDSDIVRIARELYLLQELL